MVVHNPNNWHWVDKNCIGWARDYLTKHLVELSTGDSSDDKFAKIKSISSIEGDCEVNQRKGKVISLFDLQLVILVDGHVGDEEFEGSISVPEVAFDSGIDDYQFDISIYKENSKLNEIKPTIREDLLPKLRELFQRFGKDLLIEHGNDIQVPENQVNSQFTKSNQQESFKETNTVIKNNDVDAQTPVVKNVIKEEKKIAISSTGGNKTTIHLEPSFIVPATEIYTTFIDKERIMMFSRGSVRVTDSKNTSSKTLIVGDKFELFDGNISCELIETKENTLLVFKWRLRDWPSKIWSTLNMEFHESKEYHETKVQVTWSGIPVGDEDRVRANFENYYVRPIKLTFGFGVVL